MQTAPAHSLNAHVPVAALDSDRRATFLNRTYTHLLFAILAFVGIEAFLFSSGLAATIASVLLGVSWLVVLGGFLIVSWFGSRMAMHTTSLSGQYLGLSVYVVAESIVFVPLLFIANFRAPGAIQSAATVTLMGFVGLTAVAFSTRKDFSFLGAFLRWLGVLALVLIVASVLFGFELGTLFSVAMVAFAGAAVLYDTSNVLHRFPEDRYVGASLQLFAAIALMFWYVLRLFLGGRR
jgi:FtsH-binding integral membrane protein